MMIALRGWREHLRGFLLYSINCDSRSPDFELYNLFSQDPFYRNQVTEFTVTLHRNSNFNPRLLLRHPCLRIINLAADYGYPRIRHTQENIMHLVATPEVVYDFHYCELTRQMMLSNLGIRLHTLVLNFDHVNTTETSIVMEFLQNLPLLRHLVLNNPTFRVIYLEVLHNNLPGLTSIELNGVHITAGPIVTDVQPALSITRAYVRYGGRLNIDNFAVYDAFENYAIAKYPRGLTFARSVFRD